MPTTHAMKRPDRNELSVLLRVAREQVEANGANVATTKTFRRDLVALDWNTPDQVVEGLKGVFTEVQPTHYCGERPPMVANDPACPGAELFPFSWKSESIGRQMYFKIGVFRNKSVCFVSLHSSTL